MCKLRHPAVKRSRLITKASIIKGNRDKMQFQDKVVVWYEDTNCEVLFRFYPDELSFSGDEFIGLTRGQAMNLRLEKDVNYLRS